MTLVCQLLVRICYYILVGTCKIDYDAKYNTVSDRDSFIGAELNELIHFIFVPLK